MKDKRESQMSKEEKEKLLLEIEDRIQKLIEHRSMWGHAGGVGGRMAMQATQEIKELKMQRDDLKNNTHTYRIYLLERELKRLRLLRDEAKLLNKRKLTKEIEVKEEEIKSLRSK